LKLARLLFMLVVSALPAAAQGRPEFRGDAIISRTTAVHAGVGVLFPLGTYVRSGLVAGAGISAGEPSFRADLVNLFHVDPFRESRWGPYGGGGLSFRHDNSDSSSNTFLLIVLGLEGPVRHGFSPAFEIGLGGGARAGVVLRRAAARTR
jgi:hypothetical protein